MNLILEEPVMKTLLTVIATASLFASMPVMAQEQSAAAGNTITSSASASPSQLESRWHPRHRRWHRGWGRGPGCYIGFFRFGCHGDVAAEQEAE